MRSKTTLFSLMAIVAAAFVVPASASALEWKEEGKALTKDATVTFEGEISTQFEGGIGGISCGVKGSLTLEAGKSTAKVSSLAGSEKGCQGTGALSTCKPISITIIFTEKPISVDVEFSLPPLHVTGGLEIDFKLNKCGSFAQTTVLTTDMRGTPDNNKAMSLINLSGTGTTSNENIGGFTLKGVWNLAPAKKYGFE
jgi:hypothetical protein